LTEERVHEFQWCWNVDPFGGWNYDASKEATLEAHKEAFGSRACTKGCLESQLDAYYGDDGTRPMNKPEKQAIEKATRPEYEDEFGGS
jgi:hypothetical protein